MSGHSKWAQIRRQKGVADARRGQLFTKLSREIELAARQGGTDPQINLRLRIAIQKAKDFNMPQENIERAIKRATGSGEGEKLTELTLEGYGPKGVAILIEALTDNRNRTLQEIRTLLARGGGSLGESGCVHWLFEAKGVVTIDTTGKEAEDIALQAIDAGAEDVKMEKTFVEVHAQPQDLEKVRKFLESQGHCIASAEISLVPKTIVPLDKEAALTTLRLLDKLEELSEVQRLYSNADFSEEALEVYRKSLG